MQPKREAQDLPCCQDTGCQILRGNGDLEHPAAVDDAGCRIANLGYHAKLGSQAITPVKQSQQYASAKLHP